MSVPTVLIVDDETVACQMASSVFNAEGYNTLTATNGDEMHHILDTTKVDLILLDINLPGKNGLILAREIREKRDVALMFVTSRDNEIDRILGLEIGADDYITKPFNPRELTIRARNLINRTKNVAKAVVEETSKAFVPSNTEAYKFQDWVLDTNTHTLTSPDGEYKVKLPRAEYRMLQYFCEHAKLLISRTELLQYMLGRDLKEHDRTVDVAIRKLRKHLENGNQSQNLIETIHGEGYRFGTDVIF